jgi:hypothetical protein
LQLADTAAGADIVASVALCATIAEFRWRGEFLQLF